MFWGSKEKFIEIYVDDILFNFKQIDSKRELVINKIERPNELWDLTPYFEANIYSDSDDEIKKLLHEITKPIYEIFDEIQNKKKDWMPDEELQKLSDFESILKNIFFLAEWDPFDYSEFDQVIAGIKKSENSSGYIEESPYDIETFLENFDFEIENLINNCIFESENDFIDDGCRIYLLVRFKLFKVFWSAFFINEDLIDVINFMREFSRYRCIVNHKGCLKGKDYDEDNEYKFIFDEDYLEKIKGKYKKQKLKFQEYQKSYFYNKNIVSRSALIFKDFSIEYNQKIQKINF